MVGQRRLNWGFYCCGDTPELKRLGEENGTSLSFPYNSSSEKQRGQELTQGKNLEVGAEAGAMEDC